MGLMHDQGQSSAPEEISSVAIRLRELEYEQMIGKTRKFNPIQNAKF